MSANEEFILEILQESGLATRSQIEAARGLCSPGQVVATLIEQGVLTEEDESRALAAHAAMEFVDLASLDIPADVIAQVPREIVDRFKVLPVGESDSGLVIAVSNPLDFDTFDSLGHMLARPAEFVCATEGAILAAMEKYYGIGVASDGADRPDPFATDQILAEGETGDAPIIKMVTSLLMESYKLRASDIHLEPLEKVFRVRLRIDGVLQEMQSPPKRLQAAIISRIKIMTGTMSIAEKRLPQDGRIQVTVGQRQVDLRVSTVPTNHGESIVMRVLDKSALQLGLPQLGFLSDDQEDFDRLLALPDGILLVTGPTG
ncbi:MAG: Flp pilus assembly complex ATPase component, partial [Verrucomicrobiota bacterium]